MEPQHIVLIVDDEPGGRDTLEALLVAEGYHLAFAENGPEALAQAAALTPDVILLDVMMPGMDGFDVCHHLRANPALAEVPVILVTALDDALAGSGASAGVRGGRLIVTVPPRSSAVFAARARVQ